MRVSQYSQGRPPHYLVTLHRPSNVDNPDILFSLCRILVRVSEQTVLVFPVHPRTAKNLREFGLYDRLNDAPGIILTDPLGYKAFMNLIFGCKFVITDSGGIQEETTVLDIPCITLRDTTERPVTLTEGTNVLVKDDPKKIVEETSKILNGNSKKGNCPSLWDGHIAERIVKILVKKNGSGITEKLPVELKSHQTDQTK